MVADLCTFNIDGRFVPGQDYDDVLARLRQMIQELEQEDPSFKAEADFCSRTTNAVRIDDKSDLVKAL